MSFLLTVIKIFSLVFAGILIVSLALAGLIVSIMDKRGDH